MSGKEKVICKTTNLYVAAYLNFKHLYKGDDSIRFVDIVNDTDSTFGNGKPKKAFRFEVNAEVKAKVDGRVETVKGQQYFSMLVDEYFSSDFKFMVDSLKQVIPMLNAATSKTDKKDG